VLTATFIPLLGYPVLYLPIHIVWLEAMIHPTALLVFQGGGAARDDIPPGRGGDVRLFSRAEWAIIAAVGALITLVVALTYDRSLAAGDDAHARAMAMVVLTTASASVTAVLSRLATTTARTVTALSLAAAIALVQTPIAPLLHMRPLHLDDWMLALAGGAFAVLPLLGLRARSAGGRPGPRQRPVRRPPRPSLARHVHIR
jgi:Ca2+-transporting ATPase